MSARTSNSSIFFGDDSTPTNKPVASRVLQPGGTGGSSRVFNADADPNVNTRTSTRIREPGGTGGKSSLFQPDLPVAHHNARKTPDPSPITSAPLQESRLSTKPIFPGGTGGKSSIFTDAPDPPTNVSVMTRSHPSSESTAVTVDSPCASGTVEPDSPASQEMARQESGDDPHKIDVSGRKVEPKHNVSQVALGGGYPDAEPPKRAPHRGNIRADYNQSHFTFGDDTGGEVVPEKKGRLTSRVLRPGGTGGGSQIEFCDDTQGKPVQEKQKSPVSSVKSQRPANGSQIVFGDDTNGGLTEKKSITSSRVLRPGGTGGSSQIAFGEYNVEDKQQTKTSSRVLRPGGTGGTSQITF